MRALAGRNIYITWVFACCMGVIKCYKHRGLGACMNMSLAAHARWTQRGPNEVQWADMLPPSSPRAHLSLPFLIFSLSVFPFFPPFSSLFLFFSCLALFVRFLPLFLVLTLSFLLFPFLHVPFPLLVFLFLPFLSFLSFSFLPFHFFPFLSFPSFFLPLSLLSFFLIVFFSYITLLCSYFMTLTFQQM
jgi:hypothetical protein